MKNSFSWKQDVPASLVVFFVALPLCLGIAVVSDAPNVFAGLIAGIIGGIVVAALSGSRLGVSGPAAGLAVIVATAIGEIGYSAFLWAVVLAGVLQLASGFLRMGVIAYFFPNSVIKGMLSGIGLVIFIKEIPHALGQIKVAGGPDLGLFEGIAYGPITITVISLVILAIYESKWVKSQAWSRIMPGPLLVVILGVALGVAFKGQAMLKLLAGHHVNMPGSESMEALLSGGQDFSSYTNKFFGQFQLVDLSVFNDTSLIYPIITTAFVLWIVASLETLLCVEATDKLDPEHFATPTNRELKAQGIGNIISGLIGGLPITQVIVRSSANIQSGGKSKYSAIIHGFLLLICAFSIPQFLSMIPFASLAAILFLVGYKLAKPSLFVAMWKKGYVQFIPFIATIAGILFLDLLKGVSIGLVIAVFFIMWKQFKSPIVFEQVGGDAKKLQLHLTKHATYLRKASLIKALNDLPEGSALEIVYTGDGAIDNDIVDVFQDFKEEAIRKAITITNSTK